MTIMQRFNRLITRAPVLWLGLLFLGTVFFVTQFSKLRIEADAESMLDKTDEAYINNERVKEIFNAKEVLVVGITNENGIYNPKSLALVEKITDYLDNIPEVMEEEVVSFYTQNNILGEEDEMIVEPFLDEAPKTQEEADYLRESLHKNEMFLGLLASADDKAAMVMAKLVESDLLKESGNGKEKIYLDLTEWIKTLDLGENKVFVAGRPVLEGSISRYIMEDNAVMLPIVVLVIIVVLFATLKSVRGMILPLLVVVLSAIWTIGLEGFLGVPVYAISNIIPVLLIAIGTADGIHITSGYRENCLEHPELGQKELVLLTMDELWRPVVMTSLTTAAGFGSLAFSTMIPMRMFGIFTGVGVLWAMLFSLVLIPATLTLMKPAKASNVANKENTSPDLYSRFLQGWGTIIHNRRNWILGGSLTVFVVSLGLAHFIVTDASFLASFDPDSPIVAAENVINDKFQGSMPLNMVLEAEEEGALKDPAILKAISAFQKDMELIPEVGGTTSIAEFIARMNQVLNNDDPAFNVIPDQKSLIAKYFLLYSGGPDDFDEFVNYDYTKANIQIMIRSDHSPMVEKTIAWAKVSADKHFRNIPGLKYKVAGVAHVGESFTDAIINSQTISLFISLIIVFVITSIMFKSPVAGIYNTLPIAVAVALNFGVMGLFNIPLDVSSAIISAIAIGIGIDYAIHFISKYKLEAQKTTDAVEVNRLTMQSSGRAILFNALVVISGFLVLTFSNFPPNAVIGLLISLNMFTCFLASITLLPALINVQKPKFIFG